MSPAARPQWQQATALITLGAGGVVTGLSFVPNAPADLTSPASLPIKLVALERTAAPAPGRDGMLRAAIVHTARHFLRLAETRSPAEMEALIWRHASTDGADHGPSCAAFASLMLDLGSHMAGLESWVTGGSSYPWPVHSWVDGRVDPNPASPSVVSVLQDARTHGRWHPLGDGYAPQPGDWVLFDGHVEVVTKYAAGVLHTIGGDSGPNLSVNAHEYPGPLADQGVAGFVDNGVGMSAGPRQDAGPAQHGGHAHQSRAASGSQPAAPAASGSQPAAPAASGSQPAAPAASSGTRASADAAAGAGSGAENGAQPGAATSSGAVTRPGATAGPVTTADATTQQPEFAPRAVAAPRTVPRSRYGSQSRALPAQGAQPAADREHDSGMVPAPRAEHAAHVVSEPRRPHRHLPRIPAARTGRAAPKQRAAAPSWARSASDRGCAGHRAAARSVQARPSRRGGHSRAVQDPAPSA